MARSALWTPAEMAEFLGVTEETLKRWRAEIPPRIPYVPLGDGPKARIRYREIDGLRFVDRQLRGAA